MVDAVGTVTTQTTTLRPAAQSAASSVVAAQEAQTAEVGEFVSSSIVVDNLQNVVILEYRSSKTGEVVQQYPTQVQIDAFKQAEKVHSQAIRAAAQEEARRAAAASASPAAPVHHAPVAAPVQHTAPSSPPPSTGGSGTGNGTHTVVV